MKVSRSQIRKILIKESVISKRKKSKKLSDAEKELRNALENLAKLQGELNAEIRRSKNLETDLILTS